MKPAIAPAIDQRNADELLFDLLTRALGYVPEWEPAERSTGYGLAAIAARQVKTVLERLNQVPEKQKLAFLDLMGLSAIPAQGARTPVTFKLQDKARGGSAPAGTRISAPPPPGSNQPIMFETERSTGIRAGKLVQVVSLWPGRDEYIDHSAANEAGEPVLAFARSLLGPVPHHLYLSHSVLLALSGPVELGVEFELQQLSLDVLDLIWEYWDGEVWRGFLATLRECQSSAEQPLDGTAGLTSSGTVVLRADCAEAKETSVDGRNGYWIRARLDEPLPVNPDRQLASIERLRISSSVNRALRGRIARIEPQHPPSPVLLFAFVGVPIAQGSSTFHVSGRVLNSAGEPVSGAVVFLHAGATVVQAVATQANGVFALPPVQVSAEDRLALRVTVGGLEYAGPDGPVQVEQVSGLSRLIFDVFLATQGILPDKAFADATELDLTKPFYPMGQQPQPGTTFYFTSEEVLAKPGAKVRMVVSRTRSPQDESNIGDTGLPVGTAVDHRVLWEYWNGRVWAPLAVTSNRAGSLLDLDSTEILDFTVPVDITPVEVNDETARWIRARLQSGTYALRREVAFDTGNGSTTFVYVLARPPVLADLRLGYTWQFGPFHPETVLTYNDFTYQDHTYEATWPGVTFRPFTPVNDVTPTLYLGFDQPPPVDSLGIYFDVREHPLETTGPALAWQYWNGFQWRELTVDDETGRLRRAGMVSLLAQPDDASLARFGTPLHWVRARLKEDGPPGEPVIGGIFPNSVWATQRESFRNVTAGTSDGTPGQTMRISQIPVLPGESIEVRELSGARAAVEWRILALELFEGDSAKLREIEIAAARARTGSEVVVPPLRLVRDRRDRVTEAWVEWKHREFLNLSGPGDRHYALDAASGLLQFGDGVHGRIPPLGADVVARHMQSGGGLQGNVSANTVTQLLGAIPGVESVTNPRAAEGGANTEPSLAIIDRGPRTIRHRGRAISAPDYETMARESSPAVAVARALASRNRAGARLPGWVTLVIIPHGDEARPYPSFGLREHVRGYIEARVSADLAAAHRIAVIGPQYFELGLTATIAPITASEAGEVETRALAALRSFLHPLYGGPGNEGWALGRDVYLSDVVSVLERVEGLDYVKEIALFKDGVPQGESVSVPDEFVVVAGALQLSLAGGEE
jgi:hypothetical protein